MVNVIYFRYALGNILISILIIYCEEDAVKDHKTVPHIAGSIPDKSWKK